MKIFAGLSVAVLILAALGVVIKTFSLWLHTRGLPELLLTLYLACATVVGYPLAIAMGMIPPSESWLIHVLAEGVTAVGWASLLFFTLNVFRRDSLWAKWLVALTVAFLGACVAAYIVEVMGPNPRPLEEIPAYAVALSIPAAIASFWTTFESLAYYRQLKLRLRLGLAENGVTNRVLLWGLMMLAAGTALVLNIGTMLTGSYLSPPVVLISSILGLVDASCLFLAFQPPGWYRRWLERSAQMEAA